MRKNLIYQPREDSYLLQQYVKRYARGTVLDMGTGTGILAMTIAQKKTVKRVLAVDKNNAAITFCKRNAKNAKIRYKQSDLFCNVRGIFDTIIFNPPYLPTEPRAKDMTLDAGRKGYEVLVQFLMHAGKHLKDQGVMLILFSSLTNKGKIDRILLENLYMHKELAKQHIFFEDLYVYKIWKHPAQKLLQKVGVRQVTFFTKGKRGMIFTGRYKGKKVAIKLQLP